MCWPRRRGWIEIGGEVRTGGDHASGQVRVNQVQVDRVQVEKKSEGDW